MAQSESFYIQDITTNGYRSRIYRKRNLSSKLERFLFLSG